MPAATFGQVEVFAAALGSPTPKRRGLRSCRRATGRGDPDLEGIGGTFRVLFGLVHLLADASVDALAQQVGVAHVAGVLLDRADQHFAQRDPLSAAPVLIQGIFGRDVETGRLVTVSLPIREGRLSYALDRQ